jgi:hypothetical protein
LEVALHYQKSRKKQNRWKENPKTSREKTWRICGKEEAVKREALR